MPKISAGILFYRTRKNVLEVLLVHPGGPFWAKKDQGAWSIPKGEIEDHEDLLNAAKREVEEETGLLAGDRLIPLSPIKLKSGKTIYAWAAERDADPSAIKSNLFEIEWPPRSGLKKSFPEVDRASWFPVEEAMARIHPRQKNFIKELLVKTQDAG